MIEINVDIMNILVKYITKEDVENLIKASNKIKNIMRNNSILYKDISIDYYSYTCIYKSLARSLNGYVTKNMFINELVNKKLRMCHCKVIFKKISGPLKYPNTITMLNYKNYNPGLIYVNIFIEFVYSVNNIERYKIKDENAIKL